MTVPHMVVAVHMGRPRAMATRPIRDHGRGHIMGKAPLIQSVVVNVTWSDGSEHVTRLFDNAGRWSYQSGGIDAHVLAERGFADVADTLAGSVTVYNDDHTTPFHYHVGANVPGYSPQNEPMCHGDDVDAAREALDGELSLAADGMPECVHPQDDGTACGGANCDGCAGYAQVEEARRELKDARDLSEGFSTPISDGRALPVNYWIERVPAGDCDLDED